jgi:predicted amidohydrolase YtcJ
VLTKLIRDVRLVPVHAGATSTAVCGSGDPTGEPVDIRLADGLVAEIAPRLSRLAGEAQSDADGRWLVPGLWDRHVHLGQWTTHAARLDLSGARSVPDALSAVADRLHERPDEAVLVGAGHRPATWTDPETVADLDRVCGDRPVILISGDCHHAWADSRGLALLGLPDRDGVVEEAEWFATYPRLAALLGEEATGHAAYRETMLAAASKGIVGLADFEFDERPAAWIERSESGPIPLRIRVGAYAATLEEYLALGVCTGDRLPGCDPHVTMGPLKIIGDGSLNTRTAWCVDPYTDRPGRGAPNVSGDALSGLLKRATAAGLEVATHAIGDRALAQALDAYAATGARGQIEHVQLARREDLPRMAALGLRAGVQPAHLLDDRDLTEACWGDRADRCFLLRSMRDAGVELAFGSDAPVAPLDPWLAMAAAVYRSGDDRDAWHPEEALTPAEALAASVDGAGTVRSGSRADLALLDADPLAPGTPREQAAGLRTMSVAATWVGGCRTYTGAWSQ